MKFTAEVKCSDAPHRPYYALITQWNDDGQKVRSFASPGFGSHAKAQIRVNEINSGKKLQKYIEQALAKK